ncbi:MAG: Maf family protein [Desulfomonilaceae bacterium]
MKGSKVDLILASASSRRRDLLAGLRARFQVIPSNVSEAHLAGETPQAHVSRLAVAKATDVSQRILDLWILGADTIVLIDGDILGKPCDQDEARTMLAMLAGRTHEVFTGYAIVHARFPELRRVRYVTSRVHIRGLSAQEIADYVDTGEPMDKAGAYAIQGVGSGIVETVSGSYTNVVGLPICEVARDLKELGIFDFLKANRKP